MFKPGDLVTPTEKAAKEFINLARIWGLAYPKAGEILEVTSTRLYQFPTDAILLKLPGYVQELCSHCFRKVDPTFDWLELENTEKEKHEKTKENADNWA